jgi:hypothetical protein
MFQLLHLGCHLAPCCLLAEECTLVILQQQPHAQQSHAQQSKAQTSYVDSFGGS